MAGDVVSFMGISMAADDSTPERRILVAASVPQEARTLVEAARLAGWGVEWFDDPVEAVGALCRAPASWHGLLAGNRIGSISGLTLCGLARDAHFHRPALLLSDDPGAAIAIRASLLRVAVVWLPPDRDLLARTVSRLWPRLCPIACPTAPPELHSGSSSSSVPAHQFNSSASSRASGAEST
jgi:hypothetical protein